MKRDDFYFYSLVALLLLGTQSRWPLGLRAAVVANSVLVLRQCIHRLLSAFRTR